MTITCGKLIAFLNNKACIPNDVAKFLFRDKPINTRLEGCRIHVGKNRLLYICQVYYGDYEIQSDFEYSGTLTSYPDSASIMSKKVEIGRDASNRIMRTSIGTDYIVSSEMIKKSATGECGDNSKEYIIEQRSIIENFNERNNLSLYVLSYRNGDIKIVYDKDYNIESIAMFIDPLSDSTQTFDSELNQLVENILNKVSTWDSDKKRFVNKNIYDDIDAEVEIAELISILKKYN
jgi:hypothetical protein